MKITVQKTANVADPVRAHSTDAGLDLHVPEGQGCLVRPGAVYTIDLGVRVAIPDGYYGQLTLRSSAGKKGLALPHGVGVIDSGYRGNLKVLVTALAEPAMVAAGERICQLIILPLPPVDAEIGVVDDDTDRSTGGFGSTGTGAVVRDYGDGQNVSPLTIGRLMGQLQDAAFRYGADTPVAAIADGGVGYEQGDALAIINVIKTGCRGGWAQYRADSDGTPMAVIS
jgi:dUTP pyrophosphatase